MDIQFLGVGEACDGQYGNTSILVSAGGHTLLLDCGFSVPHRFFAHHADPELLDMIWISHFHGDHFLGLPLFLLRFWEMGRTTPLHFIGQPELKDKVLAGLELAYPGFSKRLQFPLQFHVISPEQDQQIMGLYFEAAESTHSQRNYGVRITASNNTRLYYSGDGRPTKENECLMSDCDLVIHEAFTLQDQVPGHSSITTCRELVRRQDIKKCALVHIEYRTRPQKNKIREMIADTPALFIPEDNDRLIISPQHLQHDDQEDIL